MRITMIMGSTKYHSNRVTFQINFKKIFFLFYLMCRLKWNIIMVLCQYIKHNTMERQMKLIFLLTIHQRGEYFSSDFRIRMITIWFIFYCFVWMLILVKSSKNPFSSITFLVWLFSLFAKPFSKKCFLF